MAALLVILTALAIIVGLTYAKLHGDTLSMDSRLSLLLRSPSDTAHPIGPTWLREAVRDITSLGSVTILTLLTITLSGYLLLAGRWADAILVIGTVAGAAGINSILKLLIAAPRPGLVADAPDVFTSSFPSGHAAMSAAVCICVARLWSGHEMQRPVRVYIWAVCLLITFWIGVSRVYLGLHWPSDVAVGWCVGLAWATMCQLTARQ